MRQHFDESLARLSNEMINMGSMIEGAIETAVDAFINQNIEKAKKAVEYDDVVDREEKEIENICMKLLLKQQPVATDLRTISAALKMITDMERIGDHAADISELTFAMAGQPYIKRPYIISRMAKETVDMLIKSLDAYAGKNLSKAWEVIKHDDVVDDLFSSARKELIMLIHENPDNGEQAANLLMVAKYFERIGDHAVNIAEWVIFSITGEHKNYEEE